MPTSASPQAEYARMQALSLSLDMTRGKPSPQQLDLSNALLHQPGDNYTDADGTDTRNYGGSDGLPAMRALFAAILGVSANQVIVGGNSSLSLMFDALLRACQFGVVGGDGPWSQLQPRKFICPTPGYDRHFLITEHLGFELIAVPMTATGPDMDAVEQVAATDPAVKGIWCVPRHSNPDGACYSDACVTRLANMPAAADFRIMWDNAYAEHHHDPTTAPPPADIATACAAAGNPDRVLLFASTSKITHPGAGVAALAASDANIADARSHIEVQSIGPDKVNQLRALRLFGDLPALRAHMKKHAALVKPKFDLVLEMLQRDLANTNLARWSQPTGGYFISLEITPGHAKRVVQLAAAAGVKLTQAGAPFPYARDPNDSNIRIAPTFPPLVDIQQAMEVLITCIKLAANQAAK